MGLIPSRAWDTEGVESLRALNAPFLITTGSAARAGRLERLWRPTCCPVSRRRASSGWRSSPKGCAIPSASTRRCADRATTPARRSARRPRTRRRRCSRRSARRPTTNRRTRTPRPAWSPGIPSRPIGTATGNVAFFAKANALVVNEEVYAGLDDRQREILEQAAAQTRDSGDRDGPGRRRGREGLLPERRRRRPGKRADVAALEQATASVYTPSSSRTRRRRRSSSRIRALKAEPAAPAAPVACGVSNSDRCGRWETAGAGEATALDGAYRAELTEHELRARGLSAESAYNNNGLPQAHLQARRARHVRRERRPTDRVPRRLLGVWFPPLDPDHGRSGSAQRSASR